MIDVWCIEWMDALDEHRHRNNSEQSDGKINICELLYIQLYCTYSEFGPESEQGGMSQKVQMRK